MNEEMIGLIPAAGKGIRLNLPYPKELYPIIRNNKYKPVSQFILDQLTNAGLDHVVFVINETKHQLIGFFGDGHRFGCRISYVVQEHTLAYNASPSPGLAHALDSAYHLIQGKTVFFGMADTIIQPDNAFTHAYNEAKPEDDAILALFPTEQPQKFGMVRIDNLDYIKEIVDKPSNTTLTWMWGCIIWRSRFTEHLHECLKNGIFDFAEVLNNAIAAGLHLRGVRIHQGTYMDLGTYQEIELLERRYRES